MAPGKLPSELSLLKKLVDESKVILLDIEGTVTDFDFVKKELLPYAESHLEDFIREHWMDEQVLAAFEILKREAVSDRDKDGFVPLLDCLDFENEELRENYLVSIINNLKWQMANDRKTTGLKSIQGLIWKKGYENHDITGHVYEDAVKAIENWRSQGKYIYIYSSGSCEAQKNLFQYSQHGDLTMNFSGYFDTTVGSKLESDSYKLICRKIGKSPEEVVFFTDRPKEICAAHDGGLKAILMMRDPEHCLIKDEEIFLGSEDGIITSFTFLWDLED